MTTRRPSSNDDLRTVMVLCVAAVALVAASGIVLAHLPAAAAAPVLVAVAAIIRAIAGRTPRRRRPDRGATINTGTAVRTGSRKPKVK